MPINNPLVKTLEKMPKYVKFFKDILSNEHKLEEYEIVMLTKEKSTIMQKKLPPKLKALGGFTILCTIGNSHFDKVLCDLGVLNIKLIHFSIFKKLGVGDAKPTTFILQLVDRSINLMYAFLGQELTFLVIINGFLSDV